MKHLHTFMGLFKYYVTLFLRNFWHHPQPNSNLWEPSCLDISPSTFDRDVIWEQPLYLSTLTPNSVFYVLPVSDCTSANKKFLCGDNITCIPIDKVCDNRNDCRDGLDEGGICKKFRNNSDCELNYCPDDAECYIQPTGPVCVCPRGYAYNIQKKACEVCNSSFILRPILFKILLGRVSENSSKQ